MQISWTRLPFRALNREEFGQKLNEWLGWVFYEELPAKGFEVREEQIFTAFRIAKALTEGNILMAEAGPGTGKSFAYLLPAICYARFRGAPVVVASASGLLRAQLSGQNGDIYTLSRILGLDVDVRMAADPGEYICDLKAERLNDPAPGLDEKQWRDLKAWAEATDTGARLEVPAVGDMLWESVSWDPTLPCDTCSRRGHCHVMAVRRHYRAAADLVVCDHKLFSLDLLTRKERTEVGQVPLLPTYAAVVLDEGHHLPETWQRAQGHVLSSSLLASTFDRVEGFFDRSGPLKVLAVADRRSRTFFKLVGKLTGAGEGKRHLLRTEELLAAATVVQQSLIHLQDEMCTAEAMNEGTSLELDVRAYQGRLDDARAALSLLRSPDAVVWVEAEALWVVPRYPVSLGGEGRLGKSTPVIFSSATLKPTYQARLLQIASYENFRVGVPFDLGEQSLIYQSPESTEPVAEVLALLEASKGRALVLLRSLAEVRHYQERLAALSLPYQLLFEGDGERGAQLERFRADISSVLFGATFWEGVDVPGESLSCCIIPSLPFPEHDPLILERRSQSEAFGEDPFAAVDLPEMLIKLQQGVGRLIRTASDRGVLALLDRSHLEEWWAESVAATLPEDATQTTELAAVSEFLLQSHVS